MGENKFDVLIVGAGFSGIGMAIKLREAGVDSFVVIEKSDELGGTWYDNQYPGCACDIPSHLYSYSFDCNPGWTTMFSGQREIQDYLKSCAERYGVMSHLRLKTRLIEAVWDEAASLWRAKLDNGEVVEARVLVSGMGALHIPRCPEILGMDRFQGPIFHSATWNHAVDLDGKNVAVIGTGASAIQFVPQIAPRVTKLYLFQRTPAWIVPKPDFSIPEKWRERFRRFPLLMRAFRTLLFWAFEIRVLAFLRDGQLRKSGTKMARKHLESQVTDPELRAKLTPNYTMGCKRVLASNDFYPAVSRPNVEVITEHIEEMREHSIVTKDGVERPVDAVIYGTGFYVTEMFRGTRIVGQGGVEIHDAWGERTSAFLGVTVNGFPNLFLLLGPNTGLGHNSVVLMIEAQIRYVMSCLRLMRRGGKTVMNVRKTSQSRFLEELRKRLAGTVWQSGGCRSWYQDQRTGENPTIWPGSVVSYKFRTRAASPSDYDLK